MWTRINLLCVNADGAELKNTGFFVKKSHELKSI